MKCDRKPSENSGRFAPNPVVPLSRFAPIPFDPGCFAPTFYSECKYIVNIYKLYFSPLPPHLFWRKAGKR